MQRCGPTALRALPNQQRLLHHQTHSQPVTDHLHQWMNQQLEQKKVEPNSGLGQAIGYALRHWEPLTLFLRQGGAPLDNNICERALQMAILHRKNSLSYKTPQSARTGDLFMSLIHTCRVIPLPMREGSATRRTEGPRYGIGSRLGAFDPRLVC